LDRGSAGSHQVVPDLSRKRKHRVWAARGTGGRSFGIILKIASARSKLPSQAWMLILQTVCPVRRPTDSCNEVRPTAIPRPRRAPAPHDLWQARIDPSTGSCARPHADPSLRRHSWTWRDRRAAETSDAQPTLRTRPGDRHPGRLLRPDDRRLRLNILCQAPCRGTPP
jgi:hypothetical protein